MLAQLHQVEWLSPWTTILVFCRLNRFLKQQRQLYYAGLQERIDAYQKTKDTNPISIGKFDQFKSFTDLRRDLPELSQYHAHSQRCALRRLDEVEVILSVHSRELDTNPDIRLRILGKEKPARS